MSEGAVEGGIADPATRRALWRSAGATVLVLVAGATLVAVAATRLGDEGRGGPATGLLAAGGALAVAVAGTRLVRTVRLWTVLRTHPWAPWVLQRVYPRRRRAAVTLAGHHEEHLLRVDRATARMLGRLGPHAALYLAGSGRRFAITPAEGPRRLGVGTMDLPYRRFGLVNPGAAPDRFDDQPPSAEVF